MFSRRQLLALTVMLVILVVGLAVYFKLSKKENAVTEVSSTPAATEQTSGKLPCYVYGGVKNPGLYYLDEGAARKDAVNAAGGALKPEDLAGIEPEKKITSGEVLYVPGGSQTPDSSILQPVSPVTAETPASTAETPAAEDKTNTGGNENTDKLSINTATFDDLMELPGVNAELADNILKLREKRGKFENLEELLPVHGMTEELFSKLKPVLCL
ncbi:MAG: helix-hairpin-helix domain-containing protein [Chloroflexi bacterium]|nr:helix-hairpin-helix domain-containing protein [Chloroflexota bacterium]